MFRRIKVFAALARSKVISAIFLSEWLDHEADEFMRQNL